MRTQADLRLPRTLRLLVVLLAAQFLLGMWVNLFGAFPASRGLAEAILYAGDPVLTAHYGLAIVLLVLAGVAVALAPKTAGRLLLGVVLGGLVSLVGASLAGLEFVRSGFSNGAASFSMAVGFLAATSFYGVAQGIALRAAARSRPPHAGA